MKFKLIAQLFFWSVVPAAVRLAWDRWISEVQDSSKEGDWANLRSIYQRTVGPIGYHVEHWA